MFYKVAWSSCRYGACLSLSDMSIFKSTSYCFGSEAKKENTEGSVSLIWWVKRAMMRFKKAKSSDKRFAPFLFEVWVFPRTMSFPFVSNYLHPSKTQWSGPWLTSMVKLADHKQRGQTSKCQGVGDDWHIISLWKNIEFSLFWSHIYAMTLFFPFPFHLFFLPLLPQNNSMSPLWQTTTTTTKNYLSKWCAFMLNCVCFSKFLPKPVTVVKVINCVN